MKLNVVKYFNYYTRLIQSTADIVKVAELNSTAAPPATLLPG